MSDSNGKQDPRLGKTSASAAEADELCGGRHLAIQAARAVLGPKKSKDADFGTKIHEALASQNPAGLDDDELKTYELCQQVESDLLARYFKSDAPLAIQKVWRHRRLWHVFGGHEHSGELDVFYRLRNQVLVIEYKTLFGDIECSSANKQLRDQAVLVWKHFLGVEEVAVAVDQPAITLKPTICIYKLDDLRKAEAEMTERIIKSNTPGSPLIAGEKQCGFCDANVLCKSYAVWAGSKVPAPAPLYQTPMATWTPEQWAIFCEDLPTVVKWLAQAKQMAKERLEKEPTAIPGFHLKPGNQVRTVVKPNELFDRFQKVGGTLEAYHRCIDVSLGRFEKELRAATSAKGKQLEKAMDAILSGLIELEQNDPSIAKTKGQ